MELDLPRIGQRCILRDWALSDLEPWREWLQPDQPWKQLDAPYYPLPSDEKLAALVENKRCLIEAAAWTHPRASLVISDRAGEAFWGIVTWSWYSLNWPEIGIVIYDPAHWGRGLGSDALRLWCEYLWVALPQIERLDLRTWSGNAGMQRLALKLGFREEARFRHARLVNGTFYDSLGFGLLREEWR